MSVEGQISTAGEANDDCEANERMWMHSSFGFGKQLGYQISEWVWDDTITG
jgi:hypothetical protein